MNTKIKPLLVIVWAASMGLLCLAFFKVLLAAPGAVCKPVNINCNPDFECILEARGECHFWCEYQGSDCVGVRLIDSWCQQGGYIDPCDCCGFWELICRNGVNSTHECCLGSDQCIEKEYK